MHVSQSKVNIWRKCQRAYEYKHDEKIERRAKPRPLKFGGIVHRMLDADARGDDPFDELHMIAVENARTFREEVEAYGDIVRDIHYIMQAYFDYYRREPLVYVQHGDQYSEHPFELEIAPDIIAKGRIDGVARAKKMNWLLEHKTHKNFPNTDHRWRNLQSAVYIRISQMLGWWPNIEGTLWNYIRSKPPTRPLILKDGSVSTRALDSLPQVVIDTLEEHNISSSAKIVDEQRAKLSSWFQRVHTPIKKPVIDALFRDFIATARQMSDAADERNRPRSIGRHCEWCEFEPLCRAELQGSDVDFIKEHEYVRSSYEDEKPEERDATGE